MKFIKLTDSVSVRAEDIVDFHKFENENLGHRGVKVCLPDERFYTVTLEGEYVDRFFNNLHRILNGLFSLDVSENLLEHSTS